MFGDAKLSASVVSLQVLQFLNQPCLEYRDCDYEILSNKILSLSNILAQQFTSFTQKIAKVIFHKGSNFRVLVIDHPGEWPMANHASYPV